MNVPEIVFDRYSPKFEPVLPCNCPGRRIPRDRCPNSYAMATTDERSDRLPFPTNNTLEQSISLDNREEAVLRANINVENV